MSLPLVKSWKEIGPRSAQFGKFRTYSTRYMLEFFDAPSARQVDPVEAFELVRSLFSPFWLTDVLARWKDFNLRQIESARLFWHVDVTYSTDTEQQEASQEDDPLQTRPTRRMRWGNQTEYILVDINGKPMETTAGELYDPYAVDRGLPTLELTWNTLSFNQAAADAYKDATNSDNYNGRAAGTARVVDLDSEEKFTSRGRRYFANRAAIEFDARGRKRITYNAGFYLKNPDDPKKPIRIVDNEGNPKESATLINEDGDEVLVKGDDPYKQEWDVFHSLPFSSFFP